MFLFLLEKIAESSTLTTVLLLVELYAMQHMNTLVERVNSFGAGPAPDLRMGFNETELYDWYQALGEDGRAAYLEMAVFDFMPYMETYALLLGSFLYAQVVAAQLTPSVALLMPATMMCDLMETYIVVYGLQRFHVNERLPSHYIELASIANRMKWNLFGASLMLLTVLFLYNTFRTTPSGEKEESQADERKKGSGKAQTETKKKS